MKTVDYRFLRLGKKTPHGRVVICPMCGQRGAVNGTSYMGFPGAEYYHVADIVMGLFISWRPEGGHCIDRFDGPHHPLRLRERRGAV